MLLTRMCILKEEMAEEVQLWDNSMQLANTRANVGNLCLSLR